MKKKFIFLFLYVIFSMVLLTSCFSGISSNEAKSHVNGFLSKIEMGDYQAASSYLHVERPADLKAFFERIENDMSIDFQNSITVKEYNGFSSSYYDSTVSGSNCLLDMVISVGDNDFTLTVEIVRNNSGFGIYNLNIDK